MEYFLLHRDADGSLSVADTADTAAQPCYDARGVTRMYDHLTAISTAMNQLGWSNYANDHEDGNGQFEQNFQFADALTTADRVVTLRYLLSMIAAERGMVATFMPKPFADRTGSGLHLHMSLTSRPAHRSFPAVRRPARARTLRNRLRVHRRHPRTRLRPAGSGGTNGQLLQANRCDDARRPARPGRRGRRRTAATTAPTTSGCPTTARVELRGGDGSANPYLAIAAALGAGIDGIKRSADPGAVGATARRDGRCRRPCCTRSRSSRPTR